MSDGSGETHAHNLAINIIETSSCLHSKSLTPIETVNPECSWTAHDGRREHYHTEEEGEGNI